MHFHSPAALSITSISITKKRNDLKKIMNKKLWTTYKVTNKLTYK